MVSEKWYCNSNIKKVVIKNGVTNISYQAFSLCYNLTDVEIADSVTRIDRSAFACDEHLVNLKLPGQLTEIQDSAFRNCDGLKTISLPESLQTIGDTCFEYTSINSVIIPALLKSVIMPSVIVPLPLIHPTRNTIAEIIVRHSLRLQVTDCSVDQTQQ